MRLVLIAIIFAGCYLAADTGFQDPKPPEAISVQTAAAAQAKPHPQVTFHASPRPRRPEAVSEDWPAFLGADGRPVSNETGLLEAFDVEAPRLVWELDKGTGYSSPSVRGEYLVYMHRTGSEVVVECLRTHSGEGYWAFRYPTDFRDRYGYNNGPRSSAVINEDLVFTYGPQGKLHCLRLKTGQLVWKRDIASEFKVPQDFFGTATTPVVHGESLILNVGAPGGPEVAAFDKRTGRMLWGVGDRWGPSYATPVIASVHGRPTLFVLAGGESRPPTGGLLAIDPSKGTLHFRFPWRSRSFESVNASGPVVVGNRVLVSASYRTGAALLEVQPDGSFRKQWENLDFDLHWTTAVHHQGHFYAFSGRNEPDASLTCVRAEDGETVWSESLEWQETVRLQGETRTIYASPYRGNLLKVDGRFLALGEHGHLLWLDLDPSGPRVLDRKRLFLARETWSPPVVSDGLLFISQNTRSIDPPTGPRLLCYDLRAP